MLIDCPTCSRSYHVSRDEIGEGRTVVCQRCDARWFVDRDGTSTLTSAANDLRIASVSVRPEARPLENPATDYDPPVPMWRRARPALAVVTSLALAVGLLGARERIVRVAPRTAAVYALMGLQVNLQGLEFASLIPARPASAPAELTIAGEIRNIAHKRVAVPRLTYEVLDAAGRPLMNWTETPGAKTLAGGRTLPFVSSPRRLPPEGRSILVRFEEGEPPAPIRLARRN